MSQIKVRTRLACFGISALVVSLTACSSGSNSSSQTTGTIPVVTDAFVTGSYVFSVTGTDPTDGDYSVVGSFVADGKGNITSGVADYNLGSGVDNDVQLTGTYTVSGTGTANVTLMDSGIVKDTFTSALLVGPSPIQAFDGTGTGTLTPQVTSGFTPAGTYSVSITGEGDGTITGSGQFVTGSSGIFSGGTVNFTDAQTALTYMPATGFMNAPESGGRGYAALEGNNLVYYVLGPSQIQMMGIDERVLLTIPAQKQ